MKSFSLHHKLTQLQAKGKTALIPYITAGDPDLDTTRQLLFALTEAGADVIELGVPFSDPIADGPVIQRAAERALLQGTSLGQILEMVAEVRAAGLTTPLVLFSYYNPIYRYGLQAFAEKAAAVGASAVLVVDLIPEAAGDFRAAVGEAGLETVFLVAPTTDPARLAEIDAASTGCIYYVSRTGVTGARAEVAQNLGAELDALRAQLQQPLIVGFGISQPEHVRALRGHAAGVVVGSALVDVIAQSPDPETAVQNAANMMRALKAALEESPVC